MIRFLRFPILIGSAVLLFGLYGLLRSIWQPLLPRVQVQLESPQIKLQPEEVELIVYLDSKNVQVSQPKYKTVDLPQDKSQRLLRILSALRENSEGLWPEALPLPIIFLRDATAILHFQFENPISVTIEHEQRLYQSIYDTLVKNGVNGVYILVNDQSETFLGHITLNNQLE